MNRQVVHNQMIALINQLNKASQAYYNGESIMEDIEYDRLYNRLKQLEDSVGFAYANSPTKNVGAAVLDSLNKVSIESKPMLSLDKVHSVEEIIDFAKKHTMVAMSKCDGLSIRLTYSDGKLMLANTRGNGMVGVDITLHALNMSGIPFNIPVKHKVIIDGEAIIKIPDFEFINQTGEFKNPRNTAAGTLNALDPQLTAKRKLSFVAWDFVEGCEANTMVDRLFEMMNMGFEVVPFSILEQMKKDEVETNNKILHSIKYLPTDGVVWKFNDLAYGESLGRTAHHFNWAIAWKPEIEIFETKLLDIDWTMGRTGVLTPVAVFEPVDDGESVITRASLHNLSIMEELFHGTPFKNQEIKIYKANMIIPQIYSTDDVKDMMFYCELPFIDIPKICPICGGATKISCDNDSKTLICDNDMCAGRLINRLDHFAGKKGLDIKGLSKATLSKLIEWGWVSAPADLYNLAQYRDEWIAKPGFGQKSVDRVLQSIEESRQPTLDSFISSIGIPLIGKTISKDLLNYISSYEDFREKAETKWDFTSINGFAYSKANAIWSFDFSEADKVREYMNFTVEEQPQSEQTLDGMSIVITGRLTTYKNRAELQQAIEARGGKVVGSVSKNTTYLINNDNMSNSAKNVAAKKLGIPVLTEEEFSQKFLT